MAAASPTLQEVEAELARRNSEAMRGAAFANGGQLSVEDINRELARRASAEREQRLARPAAQYAGERAAERQVNRNAMPFGLGYVAQPLANLITDPARRQAFGESVSGLVRDVQQLPSLDWGRAARDTGEAIVSGVRSLPQTAQTVAQNLPQIARMASYGPFADEEQQQRQIDMSRFRGDQAGVQAAARQANASTGQAVTNVAGVVGAPLAATPLRAAGLTGALTAPHAFAGDAPLQERIPQGVATTLGASAFGAGAQMVADGVTSALQPRPVRGRAPSAERAAAFERAGVRPTAAAVIGGESGGGITNLIRENFIAGGRVRGALQRSVDDTAAAAERMAQQAGTVVSPETAGETIQRGIKRFARGRDVPNPSPNADPTQVRVGDWSFAAKANALYDRVFRDLGREEQAIVSGRAGPTVTVDATRGALERIMGRTHGPATTEAIQSPRLQQIANAIEADAAAGQLRFQDLRAWRTWVREAQTDDTLRQGLDNAALQQIESALTDDIYRSAAMIGGDAARQLRSVDRWYRGVSQRIEDALQPFADRANPAQAYDRVIQLAGDRGARNARQLAVLRSSLRPDEWRQVQATIISRLGRVSAGHPASLEGGFSPTTFATNYANLSPQGRAVLFGRMGGDSDLASALDNLAQVAGMQRSVERMANAPRSGVTMQNFGTVAALANPQSMAATVGVLAGMAITGEMLTNPAFVRWLASAAEPGQTLGGMNKHLATLASLASRDPALAPAYVSLEQQISGATSPEQSGPGSQGR